MVEILSIETTGLGDRSYLVHDGSYAVVIDPQLDIDRILDLARHHGVQITTIAETHIHNDYVSGGLTLAKTTGALYLVSDAEQVDFVRVSVAENSVHGVGSMRFRIIATPGHTPTHVSYVLEQQNQPIAVFSGGSLLYGSVGRTDLISPELTEPLARSQFHSARRLAELPDQVTIWPTHGFGSFCSSSPTSGSSRSTIGNEKITNIALISDDEDDFVETIMAGLGAYPRYYSHMGGENRRGAKEFQLFPISAFEPEELRRRLKLNEWVIDLRARRSFAALHLHKSISFPLETQFATYVGWIVPWGEPITLLADTEDQIVTAQRELLRIGFTNLAGKMLGGLTDGYEPDEVSSYPAISFRELGTALTTNPGTILDVRAPSEVLENGAIEGSINIPLYELTTRYKEVPEGHLYIHCAGGFRAAIAASLLEAKERVVTLVNDDFANLGQIGRRLVQ